MNDMFPGGKFSRPTRNLHIRVGDMRVSPAAQREYNANKVNRLARDFDPNKMGEVTLSHRDGNYWIIDGQHRILAFRERFGEAADSYRVECSVWDGLTEEQEALKFLELNDSLTVTAYDKFRVGVTAGQPVPTDIDRIVQSLGLKVSKHKAAGAVHAVASLDRTYREHGPIVLAHTLATIRDGLGDHGFEGHCIVGIGMFVARYGKRVDNHRLAVKLQQVSGGFKGLMQYAYKDQEKFGGTLAENVASAVTSFYNRGLRGSSSLGSWRKSEAAA